MDVEGDTAREEGSEESDKSHEIEVIEGVDMSQWTSFPLKVYSMVFTESVEHPSAIRWVENGGAFTMNKSDPFFGSIVKKYFPDYDYAALERRLEKYGWICQNGIFHHPCFHRDEPDTLSLIERAPSTMALRHYVTPITRENEGSRDCPITINDDCETDSETVSEKSGYNQTLAPTQRQAPKEPAKVMTTEMATAKTMKKKPITNTPMESVTQMETSTKSETPVDERMERGRQTPKTPSSPIGMHQATSTAIETQTEAPDLNSRRTAVDIPTKATIELPKQKKVQRPTQMSKETPSQAERNPPSLMHVARKPSFSNVNLANNNVDDDSGKLRSSPKVNSDTLYPTANSSLDRKPAASKDIDSSERNKTLHGTETKTRSSPPSSTGSKINPKHFSNKKAFSLVEDCSAHVANASLAPLAESNERLSQKDGHNGNGPNKSTIDKESDSGTKVHDLVSSAVSIKENLQSASFSDNSKVRQPTDNTKDNQQDEPVKILKKGRDQTTRSELEPEEEQKKEPERKAEVQAEPKPERELKGKQTLASVTEAATDTSREDNKQKCPTKEQRSKNLTLDHSPVLPPSGKPCDKNQQKITTRKPSSLSVKSTKSKPHALRTLKKRVARQYWQKIHWKTKKRIMKDLVREISSRNSRERQQQQYDFLQRMLAEKRDAVLSANRSVKRPLLFHQEGQSVDNSRNKKMKSSGRILMDSQPPLEPFTSCIFVKKAYHAQDMKELKYVPYFDDDESNDDILSDDLFDTEARERQLDRGPEYQQELKTLEIDQLIRQSLAEITHRFIGFGQENDVTPFMEIIAESLGVELGWIVERHSVVVNSEEKNKTSPADSKSKVDTDESRYLDGVDSFRSLFCRQCFTYDCNLHGNLQKASLQLQYELGVQKLRDGFWKNQEKLFSTPTSQKLPCHEYPQGPRKSLTEFHKAVCKRLFLAFQGDVDRIASTMCAPRNLVAEYVETRQMKLPQLGQMLKTNGMKIKKSRSRKNYNQAWLRRIERAEIHPFFTPCTHDEPCTEKCCWCVQNAFFCTPACAWGYRSQNFFRGCNCKGACNTNSCMCFAASRECDPDLCKQCGTCSDPPDKPATKQRCRNDNVSMRRHCHLLVGISGVAGWGLFAKYALKKGDYIHEYVGELVSQDEAERRGRIYDKQNRSYLFNLSSDFALDATRKGNKTRFVNHSDTPNCIPKIFFVKGIYRIGLFARENIAPQTELFFDYGYNNSMSNHLIHKPGKTVDWMIDPSMASKISKGK